MVRSAIPRGGPRLPESHPKEKPNGSFDVHGDRTAELLGISRTTAYECVRRGEIPSLTLGRRVVISRVALDALLNTAVDSGIGDDAVTRR